MNTARIERWITIKEFKHIVSSQRDSITINDHALDHLDNHQRKMYDGARLIKTLMQETPQQVGIQRNGRYAAFYHRKDHFLKLIIEKKPSRLEIITFINTDFMPSLTKEQ